MRARPNRRGWWRRSRAGPPDRPRAAYRRGGLRIMCVALIAAVAALGVVVGCGADVSVDESTIGSDGVPGDDGSSTSSTFRLGEGVTFPEGFPAIGIPSDAKVTKAGGSEATGNYLVIYYSKKPVKDVLQGHLDALARLGYTDVSKDLTSSDDGGVIMSILAMNGTSAWIIRGGGKPGSDGRGYWVQRNRLAMQ